MTFEITYGKREYKIEVERSMRKGLSITVHPDLRIIAKAPVSIKSEEIQKRLVRKSAWITRQIDFFSKYHPILPKRRYISGETHYYLGRQYRLRIRQSNINRVRLIGRYFEVEVSTNNHITNVKTLMEKWYSQHAQSLLQRRLDIYLADVIRLGAKEPEVRFRRMQKRWGSCSHEGIIVLNTELVKAPIFSMDYVIIHELCHLIYPNHDSKYYRLLAYLLPDWKKRKDRLEATVL